MILNVLTIAMMLVITGLWCTSQKGRGFFSSFLCMVCVIAAGAIAFGVWEPVTMLILENAGDAGGGLVERIAPTAALLLPFCLALAILRFSVDAFVGKNVDFDDATNFIGGMVCGVVSAAVTTGTVVVALNFLGVGNKLMGHQYIENESGNLVYASSLWVPVDKITVAMYEKLSTAGFASSTPLAQYAPDLHEQAALSRAVFETERDNKTFAARASLAPDERTLQIKGRMTTTGELSDLLSDRWFPDRTHNVRRADGEAPTPGSTSEVIFLQVQAAGAAEASGQIVFTPGQIRLIATDDDEGVAIHPHAVFAKASESAGALTRFRFDDTNETIASPGRGGEHVFGFEFLVPPGFTPDSLIVRNIRRSLDDVPQYPETGEALAGASARDSVVLGGEVVAALDISMGGIDLPAPGGTPIGTDNPTLQTSAVIQTPTLPDRFGITLNREGPNMNLATVQRGRSSTQLVIQSGRGTYSAEQIGGAVGASDTVAKTFEQPDGKRVIMIPLKERKQESISVFGRAVQQLGTSAQPLLYDRSSSRYFQAFGFVHIDTSDNVTIQYDFTKPVTNMSQDMPGMVMTGSGTGIYLVFVVDRGVAVTDFVLNLEGESEPRYAVRFQPPIPAG